MLKPEPLYIMDMADLSEIGLIAFAQPERVEEFLDRLIGSATAPAGRAEAGAARDESHLDVQPALAPAR
jgi:hypothetical protein